MGLRNALYATISGWRLVVYALVGLLAFWVGAKAINGLFPGNEVLQVYQAHHRVPVPVEVPVTKTVTRWKTERIEVPVQVFVPTEKEAAKVEKDFGFTIQPTDKTLGIFDVPRAPRGGKAWVRLDEEGSTRFSFVENKAPFLELGGEWRIGVGASFDQDRKIGYEAELKKDLLTIKGDWHLSAAARASLVDSETDVKALVRLERSF